LGSLIVLSWHADAPSALVALHSSKTIYCAQFHEKCHGRHPLTELLSRRIFWRDYLRSLLLETFFNATACHRTVTKVCRLALQCQPK
jgi:hypothetical protein